MADNFCNNISVPLLLLCSADRKKISVIKLHKTSGSKCRDGTRKNNRNSGNDLFYSKHVIQGEKMLPYIRGIRVKTTRHTTCHNQRWTTPELFVIFCLFCLKIELNWNHCLFPLVWSVNFVEVILVTAVNLWECCDLDMFYSELVVSWKKILYSLTL